MTEAVYLLRLCLYSLSFLLVGLMAGIVMALPEGRRLCGLPDDAVERSISAEVAFAMACPGQQAFAQAWARRRESTPLPDKAKEKSHDLFVALTVSCETLHDRIIRSVRPWLVLVGLRGNVFLAVLLASSPQLLVAWLLGRRQSWLLFRRGEPATDAQRVTWAWMAGMTMCLMGVLISAPVAAPLSPWLLPAVLLVVALLYPLRAATAARM